MTDALSVENGAIMTNASRWSLMIDPQLQGIKWIINKELPNGLKIIQQSQAKYIDTVRHWILESLPWHCSATWSVSKQAPTAHIAHCSSKLPPCI